MNIAPVLTTAAEGTNVGEPWLNILIFGIFVAITVSDWTLADSGRPAM